MFDRQNRKLFIMGRLFWVVVLCCALTGAVFANNDDEGSTSGLQGTWRITAGPGSPNEFFSLLVFNKDGTMTEASSIRGNTMSGGVWKKIGGHGNFAVTFELFQDSNADGNFDIRLRVRQTIHVDDDAINGTSTIDVLTLDAATQLAGPFPGIPFEGTRMRVIRE